MLKNKVYKACVLFSALMFVGCGSSDDEVAPEGPTLKAPSVVTWDENQPFNYQLDASGQTPLQYQLVTSADSSKFLLDADTGYLTASELFDYEVPSDSDYDGIFQLTINVIDGNNKIITRDIAIEVSNISEYEANVTFPIDGANVGGLSNAMHIKGYVSIDGVRVDSIPEDFEVRVAGKKALFQTEGDSRWAVEVPIEVGGNQLLVEVREQGQVQTSSTFNLQNNLIASPLAEGIYQKNTFVNDTLYSVTIGSGGVLFVNDSAEEQLLFSVEDVEGFDCLHILELKAMAGSNALVFSCSGVSNSRAIFNYDLATDDITNVYSGSYQDFEIGGGYVVVNHYAGVFEFRSLDGTVSEQVEITSSNAYGLRSESFGVAEDGLFALSVYGAEGSGFAYFSVNYLLENKVVEIDEALNFDFYASGPLRLDESPLLSDGSRVYLENGNLYRTVLHDSFSESWLVYENAISHSSSSFGGNIIYADDQFVVAIDGAEQAVYRFYLTGGREKVYERSANNSLNGALFLNSSNTEIVTFDWRDYSYKKIDLIDWAIKEERQFEYPESDLSISWAYPTFNWAEEQFYITKVLSWGGVEASSDAHVVSLDVVSGRLDPLVTGFELEASINAVNQERYRIGSPSYNPLKNELLFSMMSWNMDGAYESVHVYSLAGGELSTTSQSDLLESESFPDVDYFSVYDEVNDRVATSRWLRGFVKLVEGDGNINVINTGGDPYRTTIGPEIDTKNNRIFVTGFYPDETNPDYPDTSTGDLVAFDIATGSRNIIASNEVGYGLPLNWAEVQYDEENDRLYLLYNGYLMMIDPEFGDRVLLPIN